MRFFVGIILLGLSTVLLAPIAQAFDEGYQCIAAAETTVGYAPTSNRIETDAGKIRNPYKEFLIVIESFAQDRELNSDG